MNYFLSINFCNKPGALVRIALIFERRGHSIEALKITHNTYSGLSEMSISAKGTFEKQEQIIKQIHKLIDVVSVELLPESSFQEKAFASASY